MGIVDDDIAKVRDASDLVAIASQYTQGKRVGRRWQALCPFHAEKSPSFSVNPELGLYMCFGCGASGDVISFVRDQEHLDFVGAVEWLAAKAGITLRYTDRGESEGRKRRARLIDAMAKAVDWYHERLLTAPDAAKARGYLRARGLDGDEVRSYRIGWAPEGWDELARALRLPDDVLRDTGLGFINRRDRQQDAFRGRVLFPIFDTQGDPVAFGGRALPGTEGPKYKNSPETPIYVKSKVLYGLNWVKANIVAADEAVVCEGYTDVIGFAHAGVPRAVATCGTALTEEHLLQLKKFARRVVLAFDADAAGQHAAERFYAWERKLDIDVAVAALPAGVDPAELARSDPDALRKSVEQAVPFLGFRVERVLDGANLASPEGRAKAAEAALEVIREHPSDFVRDQYLMEVAGRCRVDPDQLRASLRRPGAKRLPVDRPVAQAAVVRQTPETEALRLFVNQRPSMEPYLHEVLFTSDLNVSAFRALASAPTFHDALGAADPSAAELLQRLAVEDTDAEPDDVLGLLVREAAGRALRELEAEARQSDDPLRYTAEMGDVQRFIEQLGEPATRLGAVEQLLPWLVRRSEDGGRA